MITQLIPKVTIYPYKMGGKAIVLDDTDISGVSGQKSGKDPSGTFSLTLTRKAFLKFNGLLQDNDLVQIERVDIRTNQKAFLMTGLVTQRQGGYSRNELGMVTVHPDTITGNDLGKRFVKDELYLFPYMGTDPWKNMQLALSKYPIYGARSIDEAATTGDPGNIINNLIRALRFGEGDEPEPKLFSIAAIMSNGKLLSDYVDLSGINKISEVDPGILWGYGIFSPDVLFGNIWQTMEKFTDRSFQELWIDTDSKTGIAMVNFRPIPYWCHDRLDDWDNLTTFSLYKDTPITSFTYVQDITERYNYYAVIPVGYMTREAATFNFYDKSNVVKYPDRDVNVKIPIIETKHRERHDLSKLEVQLRSLPWELARQKKEQNTDRVIEESVFKLTCRLWDYYFASDMMYKGNLTIRPEKAALNQVNTRIFDEVKRRHYYIQNSDWEYTKGKGWTDSYQLIRGINNQDFFDLLSQRNNEYD